LVEQAVFRVQHGGAEHTHAQYSHAKVKFRWVIVDVSLDSMLCDAVLEEGCEPVLC
jgi:hypothetical protein